MRRSARIVIAAVIALASLGDALACVFTPPDPDQLYEVELRVMGVPVQEGLTCTVRGTIERVRRAPAGAPPLDGTILFVLGCYDTPVPPPCPMTPVASIVPGRLYQAVLGISETPPLYPALGLRPL